MLQHNLLVKSTIICLPPKPSTSSPPPTPKFEEEADLTTKHDEIKGTTLNTNNAEERNCCRDSTSLENSNQKRSKGMTLEDKKDENEIHCNRDTTSPNKREAKRSVEELSCYSHGPSRKMIIRDHPFIRMIKEVLHQNDEAIASPPITFEFSRQAAMRNWEIIKNIVREDKPGTTIKRYSLGSQRYIFPP